MRALAACCAVMALGGCEATGRAADEIARERAKSVVNTVVAQRVPGVRVAPVTDCVIDAASAGEIVQIARASVTGITPETTQTVIEIAQRPDAVQCIARNGLTLLGG